MGYELKLYKGWEGVARDKKERNPDRFIQLHAVNRIKKFVDSAEFGIKEKGSVTYCMGGVE